LLEITLAPNNYYFLPFQIYPMLTLFNRAEAVGFAYLLTASALIANEAVILPEVSESDSSDSAIKL
jgi:hypothetical protein